MNFVFKMMNFVSKMMTFAFKDDEFCIKNDEFCMKNDEGEVCVRNSNKAVQDSEYRVRVERVGALKVRFSVDFHCFGCFCD